MERTITVQGNGKISVRPDWIELRITLNTLNPVYGEMIRDSEEKLSQIQNSVVQSGFSEDVLKTLHYSVHPEYTSRMDESGEYKEYFQGFRCTHELQLSFPLSMEELDKVMSALSACSGEPGLQVHFTVKDTEVLSSQLLALAAEDARKKAEALCSASGVRLGALLQIRSGNMHSEWNSPTLYDVAEEAVSMRKYGAVQGFVPDDIVSSESAVFIWAIES